MPSARMVTICHSDQKEADIIPFFTMPSSCGYLATLLALSSFLSVNAEQVEIALLDQLDGILNNYCLDIAGGNTDVDPSNGLQAHTCYSYQGDLGTDQIFETTNLSSGTLYMPVYDVCAQIASATEGATVGLTTCDATDALQMFTFAADGTIRPSSDTTLCFTASSETRFGRAGDHQIADLALASCSDDMASYQQWGYRTTMDGALTLLTGTAVTSVSDGLETTPATGTATEAPTTTTTTTEVTRLQVEIVLLDQLDGILNNYCLDIAGGNQNVDTTNGLQAHTCYSYQGALGTDQVFGTARLADGTLYMPIYDVCAEVNSIAAGSEVGLAACDDTSDLQSFTFGSDGTIRPTADTSLCFTASSESRFGMGSEHQISDLSLAACSEDMASYQQWGYRLTMDGDITLLNGAASSALTAIGTTETTPTTTTTTTTTTEGTTEGTQVEVVLIDQLDGVINNYCLDIAGGNTDIDPSNGLQAHTCYSYRGDLGTDQIFDTAKLSSGTLYMPVYDVCAYVASIADGSEVGLTSCDASSDLQSFAFGADGTISPSSDTSLCFTASSETRFGRSGDHQIADLALAPCSEDLAAYQQWGYRTTMDGAITTLTAEAAASSSSMMSMAFGVAVALVASLVVV